MKPLTATELVSMRLDEADADLDVHTLTNEQLAKRYQTKLVTGLTPEQVQHAHATQPPNKLSPPPSVSLLWRFFIQLIQGFNIPLWVAALFALLAYYAFGDPNKTVDIGLAIVLIIDIVINVMFNFYQELKSIRIVRSFANALPSACTVIRDGKAQIVDISDLVIGDVVNVKMGEQIPADVRLISVSGLQINNSALTGESEPVHCTVQSSSASYLESTNYAFLSSLVVNGSGTGIVVQTGDTTVLGRVSLLTRGSSNAETTSLHREINRFVLIIIFLACITAGLIWLTWGVWLNPSTNSEFDNYITKSQNIVNTIGLFNSIMEAGALCNNSELISVKQPRPENGIAATDGRPGGETELVGDAADVALTNLVEGRCGRRVAQIRQVYPRHSVLPFNSKLKLMVSVNADPSDASSGSQDGLRFRCIVKGAPEFVVKRCNRVYSDDGTIVDMSSDRREQLERQQQAWGEQGFRVLAIAQQSCTPGQIQELEQKREGEQVDFNGTPSTDYVFLCLFAMVDPPRLEVRAALDTCRGAGIRVAMVTGDHQTTAVAIARQVNIFSPELSPDQSVDSCKLGVDELGRPVMILYRNGQQLETHLPGATRKDDVIQARKDGKVAVLRANGQAQPSRLGSEGLKAMLHKQWIGVKSLFVSTAAVVQRERTIPFACVVNGHDIDLFGQPTQTLLLSFVLLPLSPAHGPFSLLFVLQMIGCGAGC